MGDSTGLSSFWVVVAIVVGGGLFGVFGMLLGVPTMAVIYYICGRIARKNAERKGLPKETVEYINLNHVEPASKEMIMNTPEDKQAHTYQLLHKKGTNKSGK